MAKKPIPGPNASPVPPGYKPSPLISQIDAKEKKKSDTPTIPVSRKGNPNAP